MTSMNNMDMMSKSADSELGCEDMMSQSTDRELGCEVTKSQENICSLPGVIDSVSYLLISLTVIIFCRRIFLTIVEYKSSFMEGIANDKSEQEISKDGNSSTNPRQRLVLDRGPVLQGIFEIQESYNGEEGLKSAWETCRKKGGHEKYIPVNNFQVNDLPEGFQDKLLVDLVEALSKMTVRIQVTELSPNRPERYPGNTRNFPRYLMVGSGCITKVLQTGRPCSCKECRRLKDQRRSFCELYITTVTHVVYDDTEAENTICRLGYDTETSTTEMLCGLEVLDGHVDGDLCVMKYIVHEEQFALKLQQLWNDYDNVRLQVNKKYVGIDNRLAIVVGHPHGMCKHVSVGEWTERFQMCHDPYFAQYRYTTTTCSGSSGSPVILPGRDSGWWFTPAHSSWEDTNTGLNISAVVYDPHVPYKSDSSVSDQ